MIRVKKISLWFLAGASTFAVAVAIFFQNCGQAGFEGMSQESIEIGSVDPLKANAPFAFDATFNQMSYMSCFGEYAKEANGFYSFKMGAYGNAGLKVRESFKAHARDPQVIRPIYPATQASDAQIKEFLAETSANSGAVPQFALRQYLNQNMVLTPSGSVSVGIDVMNMTLDPTDDRIMDPAMSGQYTNYFPLAPAGKRLFEANLIYNNTEGTSRNLRNSFSSPGNPAQKSSLSLTFAENASGWTPRRPSSDVARAYGRAYQPSFTRLVPHMTDTLLAGVVETNLETGAIEGSWFCPAEYRLRVVRRGDRDLYCPTDTIQNQQAQADYYNLVRRHLPSDSWDINLTHRCVVPKAGDCYAKEPSGATQQVEYDPNKPCYTGNDSDYPNGGQPIKRCMQFVSYCFRQ